MNDAHGRDFDSLRRPRYTCGMGVALSLGLIVPTALLPAFRVRMSLRLLFGGILTLALVIWLLALSVDLLARV